MKNVFNRRNFIAKTALGTLGAAGILTSCSGQTSKKGNIQLPKLLDQAPDGKVLKAGLIGCGARGTGAAVNFLDAGPNLQTTSLGDVFQDKIDHCRAKLKEERNVEIADENCFIGFDSYEKVIDSGVEVVPDNPRGKRSKSLENRCKGRGEWNTYDVVCVDGTIKLSVNGKFVNGISQSTQKKGYICLEAEGAEIHFRNLKIIELP